jgi:mono/diheme cytochrome c family protein
MWKSVASAALAMLLSACVQQTSSSKPGNEALIEHGRYIAASIAGCNDCHTPHLPNGAVDMTRSLQGSPLPFELAPALQGQMPWAPLAPPIAGGPADMTDEQFARFLETGEKPDGSRARPPMPQFRMNSEDARAVAAYVKTLPRAH